MELIIYGGGSFAKLMRHYFESDAACKVVAYCMDRDYILEHMIDGLPVIPFEDVEIAFPPKQYSMFVAIGYSNMRNRVLMYQRAKNKKYRMPNYISKNAVIDSTTAIGENNAILQAVQIEPFVRVGDNNIIWSSSNICHDVVIGSHSFIAAKSTVGGFSRLGNNCFFGFNSTIAQNLFISDESLVGACSLVLSSTKAFSKNIGIPTKEVALHFEEGIRIK